MARVLTCIDPTPAQDGTCAQTAWVDEPTWVHMLPTVDQANQVGAAIFTSVMVVAVAKRLLFPPQERDLQ
ncbi:hypothetical protein ACM9XC_07230 [Xanthomonas sacchari]